jgi:hypothetical protein
VAIAVAGRDGDPDPPADQPVTKTLAADSGKGREAEPRDNGDAPPSDVPSSAAEKLDGAGNASPPAAAASDDKHDRRNDPAGANTGDVRQLPDVKVSPRAPAPKRHAASRPSFEQASLETRTAPAAESRTAPACAGAPSCAGDVQPLFGVGN